MDGINDENFGGSLMTVNVYYTVPNEENIWLASGIGTGRNP